MKTGIQIKGSHPNSDRSAEKTVCRFSASSQEHITLIQSFLFNFKSIIDCRNPQSSQEIPSSPLASLPFVFLFLLYIFYVISLFLCLISFRYTVFQKWCGGAITLCHSVCLPSNLSICSSSSLLSVGARLSGTVSAVDQRFVVTIKNAIRCLW